MSGGEGTQQALPRTVAVLGAGLMGADIAADYAAAGCEVRITASARTTPEEAVGRVVARGPLGDAHEVRWCATPAEAAAGAEIVVESLPEDLALKQTQLTEAQRAAPEAAMCTNTSSLTVSRIAAALPHPPSLVGTHYLNPARQFDVVELVPGEASDPSVLDRMEAVLLALGKEPVRLRGDTPGFVINRIQFALIRESVALVDAGVVSAENLDRIVSAGLGPRWAASGPFTTIELGGSELFAALAAELYPHLSAARTAPAEVSRRSFDAAQRSRLRDEREALLTKLNALLQENG